MKRARLFLILALIATVGPAAAQVRQRGERVQPKVEADSITVPAEALQKLVGSYELVPGLLCKVEAVDGKLMVGLMGQPAQQVFARSETVWFYKGVDATFTFNVGKDGRCDSLVLTQRQTFQRKHDASVKDEGIAPAPIQEGKPATNATSDADSEKPAIDAKHRRRLVGRYQLKPDFVFDVRDVEGHLMVGITNQATQEVFPDSPTRWSYRGIPATLEFQLPKSGPAKSLTLHQNGAAQTASRIK